MNYKANENRYNSMIFNRCGKSGLKLPKISLGLWHNFGDVDDQDLAKQILFKSFDAGITHFDLANNYGPPYGSAEKNFGKILKAHLHNYRDELIISTKAGYDMWPGPYGNWGSKKYLIASLDQSLKRMELDYVDIFYHHRPDPKTPLEETIEALEQIIRQGKALYIGISNYSANETKKAVRVFNKFKIPLLIHQSKYSMFQRTFDGPLSNVLLKNKIGGIAFSPLAQGLLTDKYLNNIPGDSRIAKSGKFLKKEHLTNELQLKVQKLCSIANSREQTLAQMALAWVLNNPVVTSVLIGASKSSQITENIKTLDNISFTKEELKSINQILK